MNWLSQLWFDAFWPSLRGNGPEAIIEIAVLALLGKLLWPVIKREVHAGDALLHRKLDHVIEHSKDIPPFPASTKESKP